MKKIVFIQKGKDQYTLNKIREVHFLNIQRSIYDTAVFIVAVILEVALKLHGFILLLCNFVLCFVAYLITFVCHNDMLVYHRVMMELASNNF